MIHFSQKIKILIPNIKYQRINGKNWTDFIIVKLQNFDFFKSALILSDQFWANILYVREFLLAKSLQKTCLYVHEKLQRNPSVGSCIKIFIFRPYGFDYLGFLTNARRGAMRSKTQWVFYRDLDWWPGPQKVQFGEITGYPEVVGLILALLSISISLHFWNTTKSCIFRNIFTLV